MDELETKTFSFVKVGSENSMRAEIISIGDELLIGQTINTNASWLGQELSLVGIPVKKCVINYEGKSIKKIRLFIRVENNLFTSIKIIDLFPSNTYSYYHTQQVRGLKKQVLFIKTIR